MVKENTKTRNKKKIKVYLLGAGASTPAAPLLKQFLGQGLFHLRNGTASPDSSAKYDNFFEFLNQNYNVDPASCNPSDLFILGQNTDIEQILSLIDEKISGGNGNLAKTKAEAIRFVYLTLENSFKDHTGPNCYNRFIDEGIAKSDDEQIIITFNYETLLEKALVRNGTYFSYEINVDPDKIIDWPGYDKLYRQVNNLLILKLHGSLNWAICSKCPKIYLFSYSRYDDIFKEKCNDGKHHLEPVLIHPTRYKKSHNLQDIWQTADLEGLWEVAKDKIASADEITMIGLSLNPYDVEALNLMMDSMKLNKNRPDLFIVDKSAKERLHTILSETSVNKNHFNKIVLFDSFENYLN